MQDYLDAKHPALCADSDENSNDSGSNDGYHVKKTNSNYNRAEEEFNTLNHSNATSTGLNGQG
jgi:hypothetical protein